MKNIHAAPAAARRQIRPDAHAPLYFVRQAAAGNVAVFFAGLRARPDFNKNATKWGLDTFAVSARPGIAFVRRARAKAPERPGWRPFFI